MNKLIKIIDQIESLEEKYKAKKSGETDLLHYGNMYTNDLFFLGMEVMAMPVAGTYVEIGVCDGKSLSMAIMASPRYSFIYGIDPLIDPNIQLRIKDLQLGNVETDMFCSNKNHQIYLIRKTSDEALKSGWKITAEGFGINIDVLLIDVNHTYGAILSDFNNWFPHVKTFGTVIFDDYTTIPDVKKAVLEIENQNPLLGLRRRGGKMVAFTKLDSKPINEFLLHK